MDFSSMLEKKKLWAFAGGLLAGLVVRPIVKSNAAKKAAVGVLAKGLELRDNTRAAYETIKEDAQDVYAQAKQKADTE